MRKPIRAIGFTLLALGFVACNAPQPTIAPAPVVTDSSASGAPSAPAKTALPTLTPPLAPPTALATPSAYQTAFGKTRAARNYRMAMTFAVQQGNAPQFSLNLNGEVSGGDAHYNYTFGIEQVDFVMVHGQAYVKGAQSIGLPNATRWYTLTPDLADAARPPFGSEEVLESFAAQIPKTAFGALAREALDGQECQVWRYVPKTMSETGIGNALGSDQENNAFGALDQAEIRLWVCADGALHQLSVEIAAHNLRKATEKGTAKLLLHIWDIENASIRIDPPANAAPFRLAVPTP